MQIKSDSFQSRNDACIDSSLCNYYLYRSKCYEKCPVGLIANDLTKNCDIPNSFGVSQFVELLGKYEVLWLENNKQNAKFALDKITHNDNEID